MRPLVLGSLALLVACSAPPCSTTCVGGCCSASGECLAGNVVAACGNGGAACMACGTGQVCSAAQACVDDSYPDVAAYIADVLPAYCERAVKCHDANAQTSCEDVVRSRFLTPDGTLGGALDVLNIDAAAAVKDGRATFDGVKGKRCLKAVRELPCEDTAVEKIADCEATFVGKVADAQTCYFDGDCTPASFCSATGMTCPGTCQARLPAGVAATRDRECQDGLYAYNGKCLAYAAANSSCAPVGGAVAKQTCVRGSYCGAGDLCRARLTVNGACTSSDQCNPSLTCSNGLCKTPAPVGETCNASPVIPCQIDLHCDFPTWGMAGTCQTLAPQAGACWVTADCATPLYCDGAQLGVARGMCVSRKAPGIACSGAGQCMTSAYCDVTCQPKKASGATCSVLPADQCVAGDSCVAGFCKANACHDPTP